MLLRCCIVCPMMLAIIAAVAREICPIEVRMTMATKLIMIDLSRETSNCGMKELKNPKTPSEITVVVDKQESVEFHRPNMTQPLRTQVVDIELCVDRMLLTLTLKDLFCVDWFDLILEFQFEIRIHARKPLVFEECEIRADIAENVPLGYRIILPRVKKTTHRYLSNHTRLATTSNRCSDCVISLSFFSNDSTYQHPFELEKSSVDSTYYLTLMKSTDREKTHKYALQIVLNQDQDVLHVIVTINDVNDNPPIIEPITYPIWIVDSLVNDFLPRPIVNISTHDPDQGLNSIITYDIDPFISEPGITDYFFVNNQTGQLFMKIKPPSSKTFYIRVRASNFDSQIRLTSFTVIKINFVRCCDYSPGAQLPNLDLCFSITGAASDCGLSDSTKSMDHQKCISVPRALNKDSDFLKMSLPLAIHEESFPNVSIDESCSNIIHILREGRSLIFFRKSQYVFGHNSGSLCKLDFFSNDHLMFTIFMRLKEKTRIEPTLSSQSVLRLWRVSGNTICTLDRFSSVGKGLILKLSSNGSTAEASCDSYVCCMTYRPTNHRYELLYLSLVHQSSGSILEMYAFAVSSNRRRGVLRIRPLAISAACTQSCGSARRSGFTTKSVKLLKPVGFNGECKEYPEYINVLNNRYNPECKIQDSDAIYAARSFITCSVQLLQLVERDDGVLLIRGAIGGSDRTCECCVTINLNTNRIRTYAFVYQDVVIGRLEKLSVVGQIVVAVIFVKCIVSLHLVIIGVCEGGRGH